MQVIFIQMAAMVAKRVDGSEDEHKMNFIGILPQMYKRITFGLSLFEAFLNL